jgi:hypothetical protein
MTPAPNTTTRSPSFGAPSSRKFVAVSADGNRAPARRSISGGRKVRQSVVVLNRVWCGWKAMTSRPTHASSTSFPASTTVPTNA